MNRHGRLGSACPAAWLIVTVGGGGRKVTVLSVLVETKLLRPDTVDVATLAAMLTITVPALVMPEMATSYVLGPPVTVAVLIPAAVPVIVTALPLNPVTASLNTAVK